MQRALPSSNSECMGMARHKSHIGADAQVQGFFRLQAQPMACHASYSFPAPAPSTFSSHSSIVGRKLTEDGSTIFKVIHPIEGFNMKGWDLSQWTRPVGSQDARVNLDVLNGIVGNMWSMYHFLPLFIAAAGCVDWEEVESLQPESPHTTDLDSNCGVSDSD